VLDEFIGVLSFLTPLFLEESGEPFEVLRGAPEGHGLVPMRRGQLVVELTLKFGDDCGGDG